MKQNRPVITLQPDGTRLTAAQHFFSLLELLEAHQIPLEYQCRSGYCGACRTRLLKGRVHYHQVPLAVLNPGEILPCCCLPEADIELELPAGSQPALQQLVVVEQGA
ncbi:MAG: class I ribonucleotide reductase maintenance protein YfaE [Enterobacteriaceae bacterium]